MHSVENMLTASHGYLKLAIEAICFEIVMVVI